MGESELDVLGPVDYLVVEFPAEKADFSGAMAAELTSLVDRDVVRVLDLLLLRKDPDGAVEAAELHEVDDSEIGQLRALEADAALLLAAEDIEEIGKALEPGSVGAVLVWENKWAAPFGSSVRRSGGSWWPAAAYRRRRSWPRSRPTKPRRKELEMPLARRRVGRPGVIGGPVVRTTAVVGTAAVAAHGVKRRHGRRDDRRDDRGDRREGRRDR